MILGLTGGIAMGKSTIVKEFVKNGWKHFDVDAIVKELYSDSRVLHDIKFYYPECFSVDRKGREVLNKGVLVDKALGSKVVLDILNHIFIDFLEEKWLEYKKRWKNYNIIVDAPLLYESNWEDRCDKVVTVSCHPSIQIHRAMKRGLKKEQVETIMSTQLLRNDRDSRADYVIQTGCSIRETRNSIKKLMRKLMVNSLMNGSQKTIGKNK